MCKKLKCLALIVILLILCISCTPYSHHQGGVLPEVDGITLLEPETIKQYFDDEFSLNDWAKLFPYLSDETKLTYFGRTELRTSDAKKFYFGEPILVKSLYKLSQPATVELRKIIEVDLMKEDRFVKNGKVVPAEIDIRLSNTQINIKDFYSIPINIRDTDITIGILNTNAYYDGNSFGYGYDAFQDARESLFKVPQEKAQQLISELPLDITKHIDLSQKPILTDINTETEYWYFYWRNEDIIIHTETGVVYQLFIQTQDLELLPYSEDFPGYNDVEELWHDFDSYPFVLKELNTSP